MHYAWLDGDPHRNWDLYLAPYRRVLSAHPHVIPTGRIRDAKKFIVLDSLLTRSRWWHRYRNVMLVDEDIFAMPETWSRFFDWTDQFDDMTMAAPALTPNSVSSHPVTVQQPGCCVRRVSFIESMMPCFRTKTLEMLLPTFLADPTGSGWGIDYAWAKLLDYRGIYVVDATPVTHWRPNAHDRSYWPEANAVLTRYQAEQKLELTFEVVR